MRATFPGLKPLFLERLFHRPKGRCFYPKSETCLCDGDEFNDLCDDLICFYPFGLRIVAQQDAMAEHVVRDGLHVVGADVIAALEPRISAGALVEADGSARARADLDPFTQVFVVALGIACGFD